MAFWKRVGIRLGRWKGLGICKMRIRDKKTVGDVRVRSSPSG